MGKVTNMIMFALTKCVCTPVSILPSDGYIYKYIPSVSGIHTVFHFPYCHTFGLRNEPCVERRLIRDCVYV
jgi:hypothetical protein